MILAIAAGLALGSDPALSRSDHGRSDHDRARHLRRQGAILPLEWILNRARGLHPGQVLEVELDEDDGQYLYEVELLDPGGRVWKLKFDARTGRLLESGPER